MGCVVNGPGESKHANIGISLPGTGERPVAPVYEDGAKTVTLKGERIAEEFQQLVEQYVARSFPRARRDERSRHERPQPKSAASPARAAAAAAARRGQALLRQLIAAWQLDAEARTCGANSRFVDFYRTMSFVNALAHVANIEDHHPDLEVGYNYCRVRYTTHAIGGLSENDFICAAKIDLIPLTDHPPLPRRVTAARSARLRRRPRGHGIRACCGAPAIRPPRSP